jgi:hypothetical protein
MTLTDGSVLVEMVSFGSGINTTDGSYQVFILDSTRPTEAALYATDGTTSTVMNDTTAALNCTDGSNICKVCDGLYAVNATIGAINSDGGYSASGNAGISVTITTAALTALGAQGSMTFSNGLLTAQVQAT